MAACQGDVDGEAKLELARSHWGEMGDGGLDRVHNELERKLSRSLVPRVERGALGSLPATNRPRSRR